VADTDIQLHVGGQFSMFSFANAAYVGLVDTGLIKLIAKEEHSPDELLCFVIEGGYIQAWSIE